MSTRRKSTGSHTVKKQLVYSMYHPQRSCSKCILCGKSAIHYTHFGVLGGDENDFITQHLGRTPSPDSCMCKAHSAKAKLYQLQEGCTPKWKQLSTAIQGVIFTHAYTPSVQQLVPQLNLSAQHLRRLTTLRQHYVWRVPLTIHS